MSWGKIDDRLAFHPKVMAAGNTAMGLWVRALAYCAQFETDGWLDSGAVLSLGGRKRDADRLVTAGLWEVDGEGYRFHEWAEYQPTKAQKDAERSATRERVTEWRARNKRGRNGAGNGVTPPVSNGTCTPAPTRPDPEVLRTSLSPANADDTNTPKRRRRPSTPLPADWTPTDEHKKRARELGVDVNFEADQFRAHAEANDRRCVVWNAAFTTWLGKARPRPTIVRDRKSQWDWYGGDAA